MGSMDALVEPLDDNNTLAEVIGTALRKANGSRAIEQKLKALEEAQDCLLNRAQSGHLLDNFLDEMLEFINARDHRIKCFVVEFIEKACRKDIDVMKKAISTLTMQFLNESKENVVTVKKIITVTANLYPLILKWAASNPKDLETAKCWEAFSILKGRIMQKLDVENEGIRTMTMKFLESVILSQSTKNENSEPGRGDLMSLNEVSKDHRFISYRKMQAEAAHNLQSLLDQSALPHICAQNLIVVITIICTVARQRPEFINIVLEALEALNGNLPPTLGTSQVKSVRKDLKIHLLRLHKHPSVIANRSFTNRIVTLLTDLGVSLGELNRNLAAVTKKRKIDEPGPSSKRSKPDEKAKEDDEDDEEYTAEKMKVEEAVGDVSRQSAIDITSQFIYERLTPNVTTNLVIISLMTLPDEMPPAFASSYTPIAAAGTDGQIRHIARMMAIQASAQDIGPGVEQMKTEKLRKMNERRAARRDGQMIPPTPMINAGASTSREPFKMEREFKPPIIPVAPKVKQQFDIVKATKELSKEEAKELFNMAFERVLAAERRAVQGGAQQIHNTLLIRLVTRYQQEGTKYEDLLIDFIMEDHRQRTDLALLWLAELYSQYHGFSFCYNFSETDGKTKKLARYEHYNRIMCGLLGRLYQNGLHKEIIYYKIILDSPLATTQALEWLKAACVDVNYGIYGLTALRELIMTRNRQRKELLQLLLQFPFYDMDEKSIADPNAGYKKIRDLCINTIKEFMDVPYLQSDVKQELIHLIELCAQPQPPSWFLPLKEGENNEWTEGCVKLALNLYFVVMPMDPTLLFPLASVYAQLPRVAKKVLLHDIENPIRAIGMKNAQMLQLVDQCPVGAEALLAKIVLILTEREPATKELVVLFKKLHDERQIDIRTLIPILNAMEKDEVIKILPKFVLSISTKVIVTLNKKLTTGRTNEEALFTPAELLFQYHQIEPATPEQKVTLIDNLKCLLDGLPKDAIAAGVERLLETDPPPILFYQTLPIAYKKCPSLDGFLSNVIYKLVSRKSWKEDLTHKKELFKSLEQLRSAAFAAILTTFNLEEFNEYMEYHGDEKAVEMKKQMLEFLPTLSSQQLKAIDKDVHDIIDDPKEREKREKAKERREKERRREREKENEKDRDEDRRRDKERSEKKERSRRETRR